MHPTSQPASLDQAGQEFDKAEEIQNEKHRVVHLASLPFVWRDGLDLEVLHTIVTGSDLTKLTPEEVSLLFSMYSTLNGCAKCLALQGEASLHVCKSCGVVQYCGRPCQRQHFKEHKKYCAMLNHLHRQKELKFEAAESPELEALRTECVEVMLRELESEHP